MSTAAASPFSHASSSSPPRSSVVERLRKLDALLDLSCPELERLYVEARVPRIGQVAGDLRGRMLAWPSLESRPGIAGAIRAFAGSSGFPWRGKTFSPHGEVSGEGINRVVSDRFRLFRFETFIAPSRAGDFDALQLDYDLRGNPPVIRSIKDEIRELEPGLWLGQAWLKTKTREILWLYFALASAE
ncbi:MAG: hypothetical protein QOI41_4311 [Myxococcales bacterium]|nr:hypothetical protein [Myxococcales bacterium]